MGKYKKSFYNYCIRNENKYILYNTLYNALARLSEDEYQKYESLMSCDDELQMEFVRNGFWVNSHLNEYKNYEKLRKVLLKYMKNPINLTITPTLDCNARCFYCYEHGIKHSYMSNDCVEKIIEFIKKLDTTNGLKINWFGGEPLMNTKVIDNIASRLKDENIPYISYVITNGILFDENIIDKAYNEWNVRDVQITLDGMQEEYEKRKNYVHSMQNSFYKILYNIKKIADKNIFVHIRINIDRNNISDIYNLVKYLYDMFGQNEKITFYPAFLTGSKNDFSEIEKVEVIQKMLRYIGNPKKLTINTKLYSFPRMHACMNDDMYCYSIDADGNIYSCEHQVGRSKYRMGSIFHEFDFTQRNIECSSRMLGERCQQCVFLPKCMGGCYSNQQNGEDKCFIEKYIIKAYLESL